ncbi:MAG: hypothetical protein J6S76_08130 [Clostridia bacterium]|nr:hypothetical protein [Clostridia bacterium]
MKIRTTLLALLLCAATVLTSCALLRPSDHGKDSETDPEHIEQTQTTDTTTAVIPPASFPSNTDTDAETDPPATEPPTTDTEPDESTTDTDEVGSETDIPTVEVGPLGDFIGKTATGRFISEQSPSLVLCIDWEYVILDTGRAQVVVNVGISHYQLFAREKYMMGAVQIDGTATSFSTPEISYDDGAKTFTPFYSTVYETERFDMEVEASWQVNGTYGGIELGTLTAGGTIVFGE